MAVTQRKLVAKHVGHFIRPIGSLYAEDDRSKPMLYKLVSINNTEYTFEILIPNVKDSRVTMTISIDNNPPFLVLSHTEAVTYLYECSAALNVCARYLIDQQRTLQAISSDCTMVALKL